MQGKPIIQWLLFTLLWMLLLVPIAYVTRSQAVAPRTEQVVPEAKPVWLSVRFSSLPSSFTIRQGDRELISEPHPDAMSFDREVSIAIDEFGAELVLVAELPETDTAVELIVEPDGRPRVSRTIWVSGPVDETVSFRWGAR